MKLYQGKNKDKDPFDQRLDNWVLYGCLLLPFAALLVRHPSSRGRLDLPKHPEAVPDLAVFDGVGGVVGYVQALSWEHWVIFVANFGVAMLVAFFLLRQWARLRSGRLLNVPKLLLLLSVIPLHVYITNASEITTTGLLTFTIIVTIFHDIQYLAIVYFYHRNRYYREGQAQRQYGIAPKFSKNPWVFMTCAVLLSAPVWGFGCAVDQLQVCRDWGASLMVGEEVFMGKTLYYFIFACLTAGLQVHHYLLDQYVWRPSSQADVRSGLKLTQ